MTTKELINDSQKLIGAKTRYGSDITVYDDSWGKLWIARSSIHTYGIIRARTEYDALNICEDEFYDECELTMEEIVKEYGFEREDLKLIRRFEHPWEVAYKFAELSDYPLKENGWEFVSWCELITLNEDAWSENALFQEAYGFRPNGPNHKDKIGHGIYARDLNGDWLDELTPELARELEIELVIENEEEASL